MAAPAPTAEHEERSEPSGSTYKTCRHCGMHFLRSARICPVCGADQESRANPQPPLRKGGWLLWLALSGLCAGSLVLLSRDAESARQEEATKRNRLHSERLASQTWGDPDNDASFLLKPGPTPKATKQPTIKKPGPKPKPPKQPTNSKPPKPAPTPPPTPTPRPTPLPKPTATPKPDLLQLRDQFTKKMARKLDAEQPMHQVGEQIELKLLDGRSFFGTLHQLETAALVLERGGYQKRVAFQELHPSSRIRVDADARIAHIEEQAIEAAIEQFTE